MEIEVLGAAGGEVTGSGYLVRTERAQVLVDFGMFQGSSEIEDKNVLPRSLEISKLSAVVLTHGHLDHTGRLPLLTKNGYRGPIYATAATSMMAQLILRDAAHLQRADTERTNRRNPSAPPVEPLFGPEDVDMLTDLYRELPYNQRIDVAPGIRVRGQEAGHMLGSVSLEFSIESKASKKVVVFSGDLGPRGTPVLKDSEPFKAADMVFLESTYGDRDHRPLIDTAQEAREIIKNAIAKKGKILVPVFAVGRAQLLIYLLAGAFHRGTLPPFPVYLDSPMAIKANEIYKQNVELFDDEAHALYRSGELEHNLQYVTPCVTADESRKLNDTPGPFMILAGSGMCTGGRILHHLRHNLGSPNTSVIIVGYQAHGSLGRRLVDKAESVRIFGEEVPVRASVHCLNGFSAHAGQTDLLHWIGSFSGAKPKVILTHGENRGREGLAKKVRDTLSLTTQMPAIGDVISL